MSGEPVYLTPEGLEELKQELNTLINEKRADLAKRLHFAIKQGDLSENADYQAAKEEQAFLEGRILEVKQMIRNAVLIEKSDKNDGLIRLGSEITVQEVGFDDQETYYLVGPAEADPADGKISHESPLGKALLGHKVGDKVAVRAPAGKIQFKILEVD